jgi:acyl dehydratase
MPIDPTVAIGAALPTREFAWTGSDVLLYHLALGAGDPPTDPVQLRYAYEPDLRVLPTFGVVAPTCHETLPPSVAMPGIDVDLATVLHGGQELLVHRPIPPEGSAVARGRVTDVLDKGAGKPAVITRVTEVVDTDGGVLWTETTHIVARGEGGFGGHRGSAEQVPRGEGEPDAVLLVPTLPQQALWYRLCGDRNPLHVDPAFAARAGFPAPILHGLCTYGLVCKAIVDELLGGATEAVTGFAARFTGVVFPGETLRTRVWRRDGELLADTTVVERDDAPALSAVRLTTSATSG